jgi:hypothetical protein
VEQTVWARIATAFVGSLGAATGPARSLVDQLAQWGTHLAGNAALKWVPRVTTDPKNCHMRRCKEGAVVPCMVCGLPICLGHVFLNFEAEGVCYECIGVSVNKPDTKLAEALQVLGLQEDTDLDELNARYRKLAQKHHPDRQRTAVARKRAEVKMREINGAREVVKKHLEREEAA